MASDHLLALDQGTSSSRAIVFDREGGILSQAAEEFPQIYPQPGWVEHDPEAIWDSQRRTAEEALRRAELSAGDIAAIGISNQRETTLLWNRRTGEPIHSAIVWQCRRTADECDRLKAEGLQSEVRARTGLVIDAYFSGTKVKWLLDHVDGARELAMRGDLCFGTVDSWLLFRLTGEHATDPSNASRTMLYNIHERCWDETLLEALDIPASVLPDVRPTSGVFGETTLLGAPIPIAALCGDQQSALFGQAAFRPGECKNTYGTGCFVLENTGTQPADSRHGLITTVAWQIGEELVYALEGSVFVAGAAIQWLRDELGLIATAEESEALAAQVSDTGGVFLVPAFAGLGAPHWDMRARGALVGLTRGTGRAHIARAALESISHQSADVIEAMQADTGRAIPALRVDGGAARNDLLLQHQADVLGVPVVRGATLETTAQGAAFLAGLAVGVWDSREQLAALWREDRVFEPQWNESMRARHREGWRRAVEGVRAHARAL